jgi:HPr kinase/phosphorylase
MIRGRNHPLLSGSLAMILPGGLLRVFGLGVLILGDSGVGKSESALELITRGHHFVSDDVTECDVIDGRLFGSAPEVSHHFMEIRGLGIINIKEIFGAKAVSLREEIRLVINLQQWEEGKAYDRMGLEFARDRRIADVTVPQITIPVAPGRNMATLIEVACKVYLLRESGYHAPKEIIDRLNKTLLDKETKKREP